MDPLYRQHGAEQKLLAQVLPAFLKLTQELETGGDLNSKVGLFTI